MKPFPRQLLQFSPRQLMHWLSCPLSCQLLPFLPAQLMQLLLPVPLAALRHAIVSPAR
jgi:hypothetical protein